MHTLKDGNKTTMTYFNEGPPMSLEQVNLLLLSIGYMISDWGYKGAYHNERYITIEPVKQEPAT